MLWWIIGIVAVILIIVVLIYNSLVVLKNRIENAWAQIDVQTKKRYDLVPNLVEAVKGNLDKARIVIETLGDKIPEEKVPYTNEEFKNEIEKLTREINE